MTALRRIVRRTRRFWRSFLDRRIPPVSIDIAGRGLMLHPRWRHEADYVHYLRDGVLNGPIALDVWAFAALVERGDTVLDAGANIGFTALLALRSGAARVDCFEPDPRLAARVGALADDVVRVHLKGLGASAGTITLNLSADHNQGSTISEDMVARRPGLFAGGGKVSVELATFDSLFPDLRFDVWKLDIEGAELDMLRGGASALNERPPRVVYLELYEEFQPPVDALLRQTHPHAYRVVCDADGCGRLFSADGEIDTLLRAELGEERAAAAFARPPSFAYFLEPPSERLTTEWTAPESYFGDNR